MTWQIDLAHSNVTLAVKHMMVTTVRGTLAIADGTLDIDGEHPERSTVEVRLDAASINTGLEARDAHLRSADFLDAQTFPYLTFRSTAIETHRDDHRLHGELTIRDVTRPVTLDLEFGGVVPNLQGGRRAAFNATTKINREDFGLTWNVALEQGGWLVGKEIKVEIDIAAVDQVEQIAEQEAAEPAA
jgi:polyisoprenoid-binding protein YceI